MFDNIDWTTMKRPRMGSTILESFTNLQSSTYTVQHDGYLQGNLLVYNASASKGVVMINGLPVFGIPYETGSSNFQMIINYPVKVGDVIYVDGYSAKIETGSVYDIEWI